MNYLELLKCFTEAIEMISEKEDMDIMVDVDVYLRINECEVIVDTRNHYIRIENMDNRYIYELDLDNGAFWDNYPISFNEFLNIVKQMCR